MMFAGIKSFVLRRAMQKMAAKHQPQRLPDRVENIVLWQFGGLGDMLLATPVLHALHKKHPQAVIHIWCSYPEFGAFLQRLPQVKSIQSFQVYDFDLRTLRKPDSRRALLKYVSIMQQQKADILVNLHHPRLLDWWVVEWLVLSQIKAKFTLGFSPDKVEGSVLDVCLSSNMVSKQHYTVSYQQLLAKVDIACDKQIFFPIQQGERNKAKALTQAVQGKSWVCLHMGGRRLAMEDKLWSVSRFILLAIQLVADGITPVLIGVESEREVGRNLCDEVPQAIDLIGETNMGEMAAVIAQAKALVGHDSGPFHIAVAVDTPVVVICGRPDAEPEYLAYEQANVVVLTGDNPEAIAVDEVYQAAKGLLACE